jgi:single-strand DNA-binding protein
MARSLNKVMLIGNVGSDPDVATTPSGARRAKVSLATSRRFPDRTGVEQERTEWHRLTFWRGLADVVERYVSKGDRIYVEGRIEYSQTQDDQGGTRYWTDISVQELVMLGSGGRSDSDMGAGPPGPASTQARPPRQPPTPPGVSQPEDDLPF